MYTFSGPCWFDSICLIQIHIFYYGKIRSVLGDLCRIHLRTTQKQKKLDPLGPSLWCPQWYVFI